MNPEQIARELGSALYHEASAPDKPHTRRTFKEDLNRIESSTVETLTTENKTMTTEKLAREAAKDISDCIQRAFSQFEWKVSDLKLMDGSISSIILSAITKAREECAEELSHVEAFVRKLRHCIRNCVKQMQSPAPHPASAEQHKLPSDWNKGLPVITHLSQPQKEDAPPQTHFRGSDKVDFTGS